MASLQSLLRETSNPLDRVEHIAHGHEWFIDRSAEDEVNMIVAATWGDVSISIHWREDFESLHIACSYDFKVPPPRREEIGRLLNLVNEQLYFGHFDIWRQDGSVLLRNSLMLAGGARVTDAQCEALIRIAIETCERYYPSLQFVVWAGKSAEEALESSLLDTMGEA
ncbi:MAG: YbjN domain-containing protein [Pseudomonadota bacterium]